MILPRITAPLIRLITPFKTLTPLERLLSNIALMLVVFIVWSMSHNKYFPAPIDILRAIPELVTERDLIDNYFHSLIFCFRAIGIATVISFILAYMSVLPLFSSFCSFLRKFRFLPSAGLTVVFMKLTDTMEQGMFAMMVFGVATWLIDSVIGVALSIKPEEIMYAKSLRLTRWEMMRELLIYGKADEMFRVVIGNFAMAWMLLAAIESLVKSNGGLGVVLAESVRYYKYAQVYATQLIILVSGNVLDFVLNWFLGRFFPYSQTDLSK